MPRILGPDGRPIAKADLTREVARVTLSGVRRRHADTVAPGLTPTDLAGLLLAAADGDATAYLTLAEEMEERSPHYAAVLGTRKRAVLGVPRAVESASDDPKHVAHRDAVETHLVQSPAFGRLLAGLLDALGKGFAAVEVRWDSAMMPWAPRDRDRQHRAYLWRDPRHFRYDRATGRELRLLDEADAFEGVPLPAYRFIVHEPTLKMGLPIRGGLARLAAVSYLCGHYALEDWLTFAEVFGIPLRLGRYPDRYVNDASNEARTAINTLIAAVSGLGSDAAAVLPESMQIEFQDAANGAGGADVFERLAERLDKLISKAVLGRSDAADSTGGKLGGEQYATDVRRDILEADAAELADTVNEQLIRPFVDLNFGPQDAYPRVVLRVPDPEDLAGLADMLAKLVPLGLEVEQSVIRDKWGLPDPDPKGKLLGVPASLTPDPSPEGRGEQNPSPAGGRGAGAREDPALNRARNASPLPSGEGPGAREDPTDPLVERIGAEADPLIDALLEPVRRLLDDHIEDGRTLDDFREALIDLYPDLDGRAFANLMAQALAVADAAGRFEASR